NDAAGLDPRPQPGSPALSNVLPQPAGLQAVNYRGAFGPNDSWADGWTALSSQGFLAAAPSAPPELTIVRVGSDIQVTFPTSTGVNYQLQSRTSLGSGAWADDGSAVAGTGSPLTLTRPLAGSGAQFFRVVTD
ncbi:MAG: hypothetical protein L0Y58_03130, partial [Verrucomicrobia subdivision 3 bacterium]|nr:hypothetical protein [Limisphaerales bacterium]